MRNICKSIISIEISCNPNYIPAVNCYVISGTHKYAWAEGMDGAVRVLVRGDKKIAAHLYPDGSLCAYGDAINIQSLEGLFGFVARIGLIIKEG